MPRYRCCQDLKTTLIKPLINSENILSDNSHVKKALTFVMLPMHELHLADTKPLTDFGKVFLFKLHRKLK